MKVPYINLVAQYESMKDEINSATLSVLQNAHYILGDEVKTFEQNFATICQTKHAISVANGTDALILGLKALEIGPADEVITTPNTFISTAGAISSVGATPVFVDVDETYNMDPSKIESAITQNTKAIIPVHLTGRPAQMDKILDIAQKHNLKIIEDAAQAVGAKFNDKPVGSFGNCACFSLHPLKNLNAAGDAGIITTNDDQFANQLIKLRNHGLINRDECEVFGLNSRLDTIQAAILNVKCKKLSEWTQRLRDIAKKYQNNLTSKVIVPKENEGEYAVYHTFIIMSDKRDELQKYLAENGIDSKIHYPIPIHLQKAAQHLNYPKGSFPVAEQQAQQILSLPCYPELTSEQQDHVIQTINTFFEGDNSGN